MTKDEFLKYLKYSENQVLDFLRQSDVSNYFNPDILKKGVWSYIESPAKRLRPSVLLMAAGCTGGKEKEKIAIPAAAGVELFHTWTLVHDDIIDNDNKRRGKHTVHVAAAQEAMNTLGISKDLAEEFGRDVAILAGDMQHGWSVVSFIDCALQSSINPRTVLGIIRTLQSNILGSLIQGETLDVQYGMTKALSIHNITEEEIERMLWLKTGVLYEFAGWAGAVIGNDSFIPIDQKSTTSDEEKMTLAIRSFTSNCGTAFQLQDDILGITGTEKDLGKPVGSDIREGKQTVIVCEALKNAKDADKEYILSVLGNKNATEDDIFKVTNLFHETEGIKRANLRAHRYIEKALAHLVDIPDGYYKDLLHFWADYMINRKF